MSTKQKRYAMVIDLRRCIGCHSCTVTCKMENNVPDGYYRSWVLEADKGNYPNVTRVKLPRLCNQCEKASCEQVCPTGATYYNNDGIVSIDKDKCIGCRYCVAACPYDARYLHPEKGTVDKCDFCISRVKEGLLPACVSTCVSHARYFGDLNDPNSEVSQLLSKHPYQTLRPDLGTNPNVYYIGLDEAMSGVDFSSIIRGGK